jgi:hypothetical protein
LCKAPKEEWGLPKIRGRGGDDRVGSISIWAKSLSLCEINPNINIAKKICSEIFSVSLSYVIFFILSAPTLGVPYFSNATLLVCFPTHKRPCAAAGGVGSYAYFLRGGGILAQYQQKTKAHFR